MRLLVPEMIYATTVGVELSTASNTETVYAAIRNGNPQAVAYYQNLKVRIADGQKAQIILAAIRSVHEQRKAMNIKYRNPFIGAAGGVAYLTPSGQTITQEEVATLVDMMDEIVVASGGPRGAAKGKAVAAAAKAAAAKPISSLVAKPVSSALRSPVASALSAPKILIPIALPTAPKPISALGRAGTLQLSPQCQEYAKVLTRLGPNPTGVLEKGILNAAQAMCNNSPRPAGQSPCEVYQRALQAATRPSPVILAALKAKCAAAGGSV